MFPITSGEGTICAIATPPGGGARGVVRLSGPALREILADCARLEAPSRTLARRGVWRGWFEDGRGQVPVAVWWMPGPRSYTREDVAELHLPGSRPLLDAALARLVRAGARLAEPGEFTRRAFANGRLDLTQAEGVLELVRAENDEQRRAGLGLLAGGLGLRTSTIREGLDELRALCEASLDFDETDTGHVPVPELERLAALAADELDRALAWETRREPASGLARVLLVGLPNAGKSTLFNALVREACALTSATAGTTRDWLAGRWRLPSEDGGGDVLLIDTPGLESARGSADSRAQELARRERSAADLFVWVVSAEALESSPAEARPALGFDPAGTPVVGVWSQVDRPGAAPAPTALRLSEGGSGERPGPSAGPPPGAWIETALPAGRGLAELGRAVGRGLGRSPALEGAARRQPPGPRGIGREIALRHRQALLAARTELEVAREGLAGGAPLDLVAEGLRAASSELDRISGRTAPEDLLDRIFARFCLGK